MVFFFFFKEEAAIRMLREFVGLGNLIRDKSCIRQSGTEEPGTMEK